MDKQCDICGDVDKVAEDLKGRKICYPCCGVQDYENMREAAKYILYLNKDRTALTNWPGTLRIKVLASKVGRHNFARVRYDVWFVLHGHVWHGVQYGDNTQICHCRRGKRM